jgi:hypothetical protein
LRSPDRRLGCIRFEPARVLVAPSCRMSMSLLCVILQCRRSLLNQTSLSSSRWPNPCYALAFAKTKPLYHRSASLRPLATTLHNTRVGLAGRYTLPPVARHMPNSTGTAHTLTVQLLLLRGPSILISCLGASSFIRVCGPQPKFSHGHQHEAKEYPAAPTSRRAYGCEYS